MRWRVGGINVSSTNVIRRKVDIVRNRMCAEPFQDCSTISRICSETKVHPLRRLVMDSLRDRETYIHKDGRQQLPLRHNGVIIMSIRMNRHGTAAQTLPHKPINSHSNSHILRSVSLPSIQGRTSSGTKID